MQPIGTYDKEFSAPSSTINSRLRVASRVEDGSQGSGETASFSEAALAALNAQIAHNDKMSSSSVTTTLNDGSGNLTYISFNNSTGAITWNGNTLDLKGFADTRKDDIVVKNNGANIEVYNLSTNQKLVLNDDGTRKLVDGKPDPAAITSGNFTAAALSIGLFINNRGKAANTGNGNDIIINRQADALINAGAGDDKIFNFAATAVKLDGGGGNDSVYSMALTTNTKIDVSGGNGYVKLYGAMTGGSITLGSGVNFVDAAGQTLAGVKISDGVGALATAIVAKTISSRSQITVQAAQAAVDAGLLASSSINFGSGANSLVVNQISGTATDKSSITSAGTNTYKIGTMSFTRVNSNDAISDAIKITGAVGDSQFELSKGNNSINAAGQTMTAVKISSRGGGTGSTAIVAGSIVGRNMAEGASEINLAGGGAGNSVEVAKLIKNTKINTGENAGELKAGSVESVSLTMGGVGSDKAQSLQIIGSANKLTYTGSNGADTVRVMGSLLNSDIDLGSGTNSLSTQNAAGTAQTVSNTNITASGNSDTTLNIGNYSYAAAGNSITLGNGANSVTMGAVSGKGAAGLRLDLSASDQDQEVTLKGSASYLNYVGSKGADTLTLLGALANSSIDLGEGDNSLTVQNAKGALQSVGNTNITASGSGSNVITAGVYKAGAAGNSISLGEGPNTINLSAISGGAKGVIINLADSAAEQTLKVSSSVSNLTYNGSGGADNISIGGSVSASKFELGAGDNTFSAVAAKSSVSDSRIIAEGTGSNTVNILTFTSSAKGSSSITLGDGNDSLTLGALKGNSSVNMGLGDDSFTASSVEKALVSGLGAGVYSVGTAKNTVFDFSNSVGDIRLDVLTSLYGATVNLGAGDSRIGSSETTARTDVSGSKINSGTGNLNLDVRSLASSTIVMDASSDSDPALLNLNVSGAMSKSQVVLGHGVNNITAGTISQSAVSRLEQGSLALSSGNVTGGKFDLSGAGSDTIKINGNLNADIYLGAGADEITVSGAMSGVLKAEDNLTLSAAALSKLNAGLAGELNRLTVSKTMDKSNLILGAGENVITHGTADDNNLVITSSVIKSGGKITLDARDFTSSQLTNAAADGETTALDLQLSKLNNSTVTMAAGNSSIKAKTVQNSNLSRADAGALNLESDSITGSVISLSGEGADTINVSGDVNANITLSGGDDKISAGGTVSGLLTAAGNLELGAARLSGLTMSLSGADNKLNVTESVINSTLNLGSGKAVLGAAGVNYSNTNVTGGGADYSILGAKYEGGSITLGDGNNSLNLTESLATKVTLGSGENSVGTDNTSLRKLNFSSTGSNTIRGKDLASATVSMGAQGKTNKLLASGVMDTSVITLNGGENTVGGADASLKNTKIQGSGAGNNIIEAQSMTGGSIILGESNDRVDIFGAIDSATINLGAGNNTLRNTLAAGEDPAEVGQGSALGNAVNKSNITLSGNTNVYLGYIKNGTKLFGVGANNINAAKVEDSVIDASGMDGSYIGVGTLKGSGVDANGESTGAIHAGTNGRIEVNLVDGGGIYDQKGRNSIVVGELGESANISTGESIYSTSIHVNALNGTLNLGNHNYAGASADKLTVADAAYPGTVKIEGVRVDGAGVAAPAVDSSGFGLGEGRP